MSDIFLICEERFLLPHKADWLLTEGEIPDTARHPGVITVTISQAEEVSHHWLPGRKALSEGAGVVQLDQDVAVVGGDGEVVPGETDLGQVVERVPVFDEEKSLLQEEGEVPRGEDEARPGAARPEAQPDYSAGPLGEAGGGEGDVRVSGEPHPGLCLAGQLTEVPVVPGAAEAAEHAVVTLAVTSVGAGRLRTGLRPPPVLSDVPLQPHRQVEILVVVSVLARLVPYKLILLLQCGLSAREESFVSEINPGHSPGSEREEEGEEEEGPQHTQAWPSLHSQCLRHGLEVLWRNITGHNDVAARHAQQRVRARHLSGEQRSVNRWTVGSGLSGHTSPHTPLATVTPQSEVLITIIINNSPLSVRFILTKYYQRIIIIRRVILFTKEIHSLENKVFVYFCCS